MTIVDLGTRPLVIGQLPAIFNSFNYRDRDAYGIYCSFAVDNVDNVFSFARLRYFIEVGGNPGFYDGNYIDVEILNTPQMVFFPSSRLYNGDGAMTIHVERRSFYVAGDDGVGVDMSITYDDAVAVQSWFS